MKTHFKILKAIDLNLLEKEIEYYLNQGYELQGNIGGINGFYIHKMVKTDYSIDEKCACHTLEMRKCCMAFDNCLQRIMLKDDNNDI